MDLLLTYINNTNSWYIPTTESYLTLEYIHTLDDKDLLDVLREHHIDVGSWIIYMLRNPSGCQDIVIKID